MPLKAIRAVLDEDSEQAMALLEVEDSILERALSGERTRTAAAEVRRAYGIPAEALDRLAEIGILTPNSGYDEQTGFTVYDTLRYRRAREELVREEVDVPMERLGAELSDDQARRLIESGVEPLRDLIAALHTKLMLEEVRRRRD